VTSISEKLREAAEQKENNVSELTKECEAIAREWLADTDGNPDTAPIRHGVGMLLKAAEARIAALEAVLRDTPLIGKMCAMIYKPESIPLTQVEQEVADWLERRQKVLQIAEKAREE